MENASPNPRVSVDVQSRDETDRAAVIPRETVRAARDAKKHAKQQAKKKQTNTEQEEAPAGSAAKEPSAPLQSKCSSQPKTKQQGPGSVTASETSKVVNKQLLQTVLNTERSQLKSVTSSQVTAQKPNRKSSDSDILKDEKIACASTIVTLTSNHPDQTNCGTSKIDLTQKTQPVVSIDSEETKSKAELRAERQAQQVAQKAAKKNAQPAPQLPPDARSDTTQTTQSEKSKAQLRAERRAIQEAQRVAKASAAQNKPAAGAVPTESPAKIVAVTVSKPTKGSIAAPSKLGAGASWFRHLEARPPPLAPINSRVHPAVVRLAAQMYSRVVRGSNARVVALLHALQQVVADYALPARTDVARGLEAALAASLEPVWAARPPAASMVNAVKHLRALLTHLPNNITEFDAKCQIKEAIDTYLREQIEVAGDAISLAVRAKISTGDLVLTYGCSSLVEKILVEAWRAGVEFRVLVVGARHNPAGRVMLRRLAACGVRASYVDLAALGWAMRRADKVVVGAGALLANGWVLSAAGTACVALAAHAHNVPVLVACETHKFSERVQTDAFVYNEVSRARGRLSLTYDVTPPALVAAVVTELAVLPCTSAPVVLRFKLSEYAA